MRRRVISRQASPTSPRQQRGGGGRALGGAAAVNALSVRAWLRLGHCVSRGCNAVHGGDDACRERDVFFFSHGSGAFRSRDNPRIQSRVVSFRFEVSELHGGTDTEEELACYEGAIARDPESAAAHYNLALSYQVHYILYQVGREEMICLTNYDVAPTEGSPPFIRTGVMRGDVAPTEGSAPSHTRYQGRPRGDDIYHGIYIRCVAPT